MKSWQKTFLLAAVSCALAGAYTLPAQAMGKPFWGTQGNHGGDHAGGRGGSGPGSFNKGAPGPVAGAGLPFLLIAGGYALVRRYRNRSKAH